MDERESNLTERKQQIFFNLMGELKRIKKKSPNEQKRIKEVIERTLDDLFMLGVETPCQGVSYKGVVCGRDPEIDESESPVSLVELGRLIAG